MLVQSLPLHSTIGKMSELCKSLREERGDLSIAKAPVSMIVFDVMKAIGIPDNALAFVLTPRELTALGDPFEEDPSANIVRCQYCGQEAEHLVKSRFGWVLICCECEIKIQHC